MLSSSSPLDNVLFSARPVVAGFNAAFCSTTNLVGCDCALYVAPPVSAASVAHVIRRSTFMNLLVTRRSRVHQALDVSEVWCYMSHPIPQKRSKTTVPPTSHEMPLRFENNDGSLGHQDKTGRRTRSEFHPFTWLLGIFTAVLGYYAVKFDQTLSVLERQVVQVEQQMQAGRELSHTNLAHVTHLTQETARNLQVNSQRSRDETHALQLRMERTVTRLNERLSRLEGQAERP